jgi:sortase A
VANVWFNARQGALASEFDIPRKRPPPGGAAAVLQSPKVGLNVIAVEGDTAADLRAGPGHRPGTPLPGKLGNSVIVGHREGWGGPFGSLHLLKKGDLIVAQARGGADKVVYEVKEKAIVKPDDVRYFARSTDYRLTLVTATGGRVSSDHLVVVAVSGEPGRLLRPRHLRDSITKDSSLLNRTFMLGLLAIALASVAFVQLRRRHRLGATLAVAMPLGIAGLFGLLLDFDLLLSPLR